MSAAVMPMCPSRGAFGRVTVEAMKLGKPVIGTRSGGTPETVQEGETGLLYTPGDAKDLAEKIAQLYARGAPRLDGSWARLCALARFNRRMYGSEVDHVLRRVVSGRRKHWWHRWL